MVGIHGITHLKLWLVVFLFLLLSFNVYVPSSALPLLVFGQVICPNILKCQSGHTLLWRKVICLKIILNDLCIPKGLQMSWMMKCHAPFSPYIYYRRGLCILCLSYILTPGASYFKGYSFVGSEKWDNENFVSAFHHTCEDGVCKFSCLLLSYNYILPISPKCIPPKVSTF